MKIKILGVWYGNLKVMHLDASDNCYIIYEIQGTKNVITKVLYFSQWDVEELYMGYDNNKGKNAETTIKYT